MERSLADIIAYVDEGVMFPEKAIARAAGDVSLVVQTRCMNAD